MALRTPYVCRYIKKERKGEERSESEGELELIANGAKPYPQLEKDGLGRILGGSRLGFQDLDVIQENLCSSAVRSLLLWLNAGAFVRCAGGYLGAQTSEKQLAVALKSAEEKILDRCSPR